MTRSSAKAAGNADTLYTVVVQTGQHKSWLQVALLGHAILWHENVTRSTESWVCGAGCVCRSRALAFGSLEQKQSLLRCFCALWGDGWLSSYSFVGLLVYALRSAVLGEIEGGTRR